MTLANMIPVFLDFDGVCHPDAVTHLPGEEVRLRTAFLPKDYESCTLFCYTRHLTEVLASFPQVRLILSTSWVEEFGLDHAKSLLPPALQYLVIGATYNQESTPKWHYQTRYEQIWTHAVAHQFGNHWIAIDNDDTGWPDVHRDNLVLTDDHAGLGDPSILTRLRERLWSIG